MDVERQRGRLHLVAYVGALTLAATVLLGMHCGRARVRAVSHTVTASTVSVALAADDNQDGASWLPPGAVLPQSSAAVPSLEPYDVRVALRALPIHPRPVLLRLCRGSREPDEPDLAA